MICSWNLAGIADHAQGAVKGAPRIDRLLLKSKSPESGAAPQRLPLPTAGPVTSAGRTWPASPLLLRASASGEAVSRLLVACAGDNAEAIAIAHGGSWRLASTRREQASRITTETTAAGGTATLAVNAVGAPTVSSGGS